MAKQREKKVSSNLLNSMGSQSQQGQVLQFLTVTSLPFREANDEESRRIVRSHAIRDANRRKWLKTNTQATSSKKPPQKPFSKPLPQSSFTTKFRLNTKIPKAHDQKSSPEETTLGLQIVPRSGAFDPFDTLPIKIGPRQQALIDYRIYHFPPFPSPLTNILNP